VVEVVPDGESGQLSVEALRQMAGQRVRLIAVTHVPTNGGLVNPAAEIGAVARKFGALYLLDACQSVGQIPIDVSEIGCDLLSVTGRKFLRGPRGTGLLYVRRTILDQLEPPLLDLHAVEWVAPDRYVMRDDARRFENWETNVAGKLGLGAAIDYALDWGLEPIWERVLSLAERLRAALGALHGVVVRDQGAVRCGIVSFTVNGADLTALRDALRAQNINISISPSEYTLIDMQTRGLPAVLRASVHYYNTEDEIARVCDALARLLP
jgi:selenocysteine lyase/cysteine desulfurase